MTRFAWWTGRPARRQSTVLRLSHWCTPLSWRPLSYRYRLLNVYFIKKEHSRCFVQFVPFFTMWFNFSAYFLLPFLRLAKKIEFVVVADFFCTSVVPGIICRITQDFCELVGRKFLFFPKFALSYPVLWIGIRQHRSALIWLSWIRVRIQEHGKLPKLTNTLGFLPLK